MGCTFGAAAAQDGMTALIRAAGYGHADCMQLLLDAGADKNAQDKVRARAGVAFGARGSGWMLMWVVVWGSVLFAFLLSVFTFDIFTL